MDNNKFTKEELQMLAHKNIVMMIPKNKTQDFLNQINNTKITKDFLEECRKAAQNIKRKK